MQRTFSYALLITCFLLAVSCKSHYISTSVNTQNLFVSDKVTQLDSQVVRMYLPFKNQIEKDMKRVIAFSEIEMIKKKPESNLTNFLADLLLEEGIAVTQKNGLDAEPVVSYLNYGGIRTFLPKGDISVENIFELMPFENEMVYLQLSGSQLQEFFNIVAEKGGITL